MGSRAKSEFAEMLPLWALKGLHAHIQEKPRYVGRCPTFDLRSGAREHFLRMKPLQLQHECLQFSIVIVLLPRLKRVGVSGTASGINDSVSQEQRL